MDLSLVIFYDTAQWEVLVGVGQLFYQLFHRNVTQQILIGLFHQITKVSSYLRNPHSPFNKWIPTVAPG